MRKEKGITLVSLVVTIIILIILAGISINILLGEQGIITRAQQAKENMQIAQAEELEGLNQLYAQLDGHNVDTGTGEGSVGDLTNKLQELQNKFDTIEAEYSDFKTTIANAITEKGVETLETDTAVTMAENIKNLSGISSNLQILTKTLSMNMMNKNGSITYEISDVYSGFNTLPEDWFSYISKIAYTISGNNETFKLDYLTPTYEPTTGTLTLNWYARYSGPHSDITRTISLVVPIIIPNV